MSKPWIIVTFILWTGVLILLAPFLFLVLPQRVSHSVVGMAQWGAFTLEITETNPLLDWTGRISSRQKVEGLINGKVFFSTSPTETVISPDESTLRAALAGFSADSNTVTHLQLPSIPPGCIVRVYNIASKEFHDAPRNQTDWATYLEARGLIFPRGGFATYFAPSDTLFIANTEDQLDLLDPIGTHKS